MMMMVHALNERIIIIEVGDAVTVATSQKVMALRDKIERAQISGVVETWPCYGSLAIQYDPTVATTTEVRGHLQALAQEPITPPSAKRSQQVTIPVHYHNEGDKDMEMICRGLGLTAQQLAAVHASAHYTVAMLGFLPGFPYLIGLPEQLHYPRKTTPSLHVPSGAIAIGGGQTGIYPHAGPGGWYVIGHTEVSLFEEPDKFLLAPGYEVIFESV